MPRIEELKLSNRAKMSVTPAENPFGVPLGIINLAQLAGKPMPPRDWLVEDIIPAYQVTLLTGNGGDGKSLLAIQLGVAVATGTDWIGFLPKQGGVLLASAEDEHDEVHRRVIDIIGQREDLSLDMMSNFNVIDLTTIDALLAALEGRSGAMKTTPLFTQIEKKIEEYRPSLFIIDALADVYGGDENVRPQVRQFIGFLRRLCQKYKVTIVLIAHPSLSGMASGSGTSGNTAWNNSVRSRLYLTPMKTDKDEEPDPDLRQLTVKKNNRGPNGTIIQLRWDRGRFVLANGATSLERMASRQKSESVFLRLLEIVTEQNITVSPSPNSSSYAPKFFAKREDKEGLTQKDFECAMERLLKDKRIQIVDGGRPSRPVKHLSITEFGEHSAC